MSFGYRKCLNHFHIISGDFDLIDGKCETEEEAIEKVERLNNGEDTDDVLRGGNNFIVHFLNRPNFLDKI